MKQNLKTNGTDTSVKVNAIVSDGIMIEAYGNGYFLPYNSKKISFDCKINCPYRH